MSTRLDFKFHRSPWSTWCPSLSSGGFVLEVTIILSDQISANSNLNWNLQFNSKSVEIWKKLQ
jgi:hypothetical protein